MLEKEVTVFTFLPHSKQIWADQSQRSALGHAKEEMLNHSEVRQQSQPRGSCLAAGAHSSEFTPSGFFRKLFPGAAAAEVSLPGPAHAHFFY